MRRQVIKKEEEIERKERTVLTIQSKKAKKKKKKKGNEELVQQESQPNGNIRNKSERTFIYLFSFYWWAKRLLKISELAKTITQLKWISATQNS